MSLSDDTPADAELVRQVMKDRRAFATLYRRYLTPVYRYFYIRTADVQQAEDLTSQTFISAMEGLPRYRERGTFAGLPVIEEAGTRAGGEVDTASSADQLPLEVPQVVDESMTRLKGRAIIDRVELAYYAPPGALGERPDAAVQPEFSLVQPVWVFHGHTEDGRATFRAYVQAVKDEYLR